MSEFRLIVKTPDTCTLFGRRPVWEKAWPDGAARGSFDPKYPYLHLPYLGGDMGNRWSDRCVTRVFWNRRQYPELKGKRIKEVRLEQVPSGHWWWVVTTN